MKINKGEIKRNQSAEILVPDSKLRNCEMFPLPPFRTANCALVG